VTSIVTTGASGCSQKNRVSGLSWTAIALLALLVVSCRAPEPPVAESTLVERSHVTMGAPLRLMAWTADEPAALKGFDAVFSEVDRLDRLLTVWRDDSEIQRLNAAAGRQPVPLSAETFEVLQIASDLGELSRGAFDVTFAALADVWKFDHDIDGRVPSRADIAARLPLVDHTALVLDAQSRTAFLTRAGMRVNLGGIGKGYAVDRAAALLRAHGLGHFMIQFGGDLYAAGSRGDRPWRAGLQDPRGAPDTSFAAIDLRDETFSTSGDYERFFMRDGRRYHHIIDPLTGEPARGVRSVTIVARRAVLADAVAKAVFVAGPDAGMKLLEELPDVDGVMVTAANEVRVSSGLEPRLTVLAPPTDGP
jgi:thiamine biosynthesis lipoprotein